MSVISHLRRQHRRPPAPRRQRHATSGPQQAARAPLETASRRSSAAEIGASALAAAEEGGATDVMGGARRASPAAIGASGLRSEAVVVSRRAFPQHERDEPADRGRGSPVGDRGGGGAGHGGRRGASTSARAGRAAHCAVSGDTPASRACRARATAALHSPCWLAFRTSTSTDGSSRSSACTAARPAGSARRKRDRRAVQRGVRLLACRTFAERALGVARRATTVSAEGGRGGEERMVRMASAGSVSAVSVCGGMIRRFFMYRCAPRSNCEEEARERKSALVIRHRRGCSTSLSKRRRRWPRNGRDSAP